MRSLDELARLFLVAVIGGGLLLSLGLAVDLGPALGLMTLLATAALITASLPVFLRPGTALVEPIWFVILVVAVGTTAKAFYVCLGPEERVAFLLLDKEPSDLTFAAFVAAVGLACLAAGYLAGAVRWRVPLAPRLSQDWDSRRLVAVVGILTTLGLLSFFFFALSIDLSIQSLADLSSKRFSESPGRARGVHGYLRWGASLLETAFYLFLAYKCSRAGRLSTRSVLALSGLGLLAVSFPVFVSSRQTVLFMVARVIVIWIGLRGTPRPRVVFGMLGFGMFLVGSMLALRRDEGDWRALLAHVSVPALAEVTVGGRHFLDLTKTAHVIDAVPDRLDYRYGSTLMTWLVAPIPRSLWPGKPAIGVGIELGPIIFDTPATSGVPPGIIGELYLNFGLIGVFGGLALVGFLLRSFYCTCTVESRFTSKGFVVVYSVIVTQVAMGMMSNSVSGSAAKLVQELIPLVLAILLLSSEQSGKQSKSPDPVTHSS